MKDSCWILIIFGELIYTKDDNNLSQISHSLPKDFIKRLKVNSNRNATFAKCNLKHISYKNISYMVTV